MINSSEFTAPGEQLKMSKKIMKKTQEPKPRKISEKIAEEYKFDYRAARPNRFAKTMKNSPLVVVLDKDVAEVFTTPEEVNKALRALIDAMPAKTRRSVGVRER